MPIYTVKLVMYCDATIDIVATDPNACRIEAERRLMSGSMEGLELSDSPMPYKIISVEEKNNGGMILLPSRIINGVGYDKDGNPFYVTP